MLYLVATPIGNLKDITIRALEVLKAVDLIACEDTRHTKILLDHYLIRTPTTSYYQHNRIVKGAYILGLLKEGKNIALVSDAGTPGILDPGYQLVNSAIQNHVEVTMIPGPAALICALAVSGKPAHEFVFEGFLPNKKESRRNALKKLVGLKRTVIFYESCHRIVKTVEDILDIFGNDIEMVCCRELTKKFEEILRGSPASLLEHFTKERPRGEFVVVL